jgi:hypothetical protein
MFSRIYTQNHCSLLAPLTPIQGPLGGAAQPRAYLLPPLFTDIWHLRRKYRIRTQRKLLCVLLHCHSRLDVELLLNYEFLISDIALYPFKEQLMYFTVTLVSMLQFSLKLINIHA